MRKRATVTMVLSLDWEDEEQMAPVPDEARIKHFLKAHLELAGEGIPHTRGWIESWEVQHVKLEDA